MESSWSVLNLERITDSGFVFKVASQYCCCKSMLKQYADVLTESFFSEEGLCSDADRLNNAIASSWLDFTMFFEFISILFDCTDKCCTY